jgi:hypothetical protein
MAWLRCLGWTVILAAIPCGAALGACDSGEDGRPGPEGPPGPQGPALPNDAGGGITALSGACTTPCHTFNGVVDQWRFSNHSHPQENEIGGGACGNCHALDGIQQRVANKFVATLDGGTVTNVDKGHITYRVGAASGSVNEIGYAGASTIGRIHCSTCHDFNSQSDPHVTGRYVAGQAPLRVPGGVNDTVFIEATPDASAGVPTGQPLSLGTSNLCVMCHKSRKDVGFYITSPTTNVTSNRWGPHNGPQSDVYSGKGGWHTPGNTYTNSRHQSIPNACVSCHMQPVKTNGDVPDHTMKPNVAYCKTCHDTYTGTDFNVQGGRSVVTSVLGELRALLDGRNLLTRSQTAPYAALTDEEKADQQFQLDLARPVAGPVQAPIAGALYNYMIIARSKDLGVHNPTYTKQLLFDSVFALKGSRPDALLTRPQ